MLRYRKWIDKYGRVHKLRDMSTVYIRNCITMITRSLNPEENEDCEDIFSYWWIKRHGHKYLCAFYKELGRRHRKYVKEKRGKAWK